MRARRGSEARAAYKVVISRDGQRLTRRGGRQGAELKRGGLLAVRGFRHPTGPATGPTVALA